MAQLRSAASHLPLDVDWKRRGSEDSLTSKFSKFRRTQSLACSVKPPCAAGSASGLTTKAPRFLKLPKDRGNATETRGDQYSEIDLRKNNQRHLSLLRSGKPFN